MNYRFQLVRMSSVHTPESKHHAESISDQQLMSSPNNTGPTDSGADDSGTNYHADSTVHLNSQAKQTSVNSVTVLKTSQRTISILDHSRISKYHPVLEINRRTDRPRYCNSNRLNQVVTTRSQLKRITMSTCDPARSAKLCRVLRLVGRRLSPNPAVDNRTGDFNVV